MKLPAEGFGAAKEAMREVTPPPGVTKADWLAEHGTWALLAGAIAAAAPHIAAQALEDAAREVPTQLLAKPPAEHYPTWLRARAAQLRASSAPKTSGLPSAEPTHEEPMTTLRSVTGYAYLRSRPGQPFQARPDTIVHPTLKEARLYWQYGTVLHEVELTWDDAQQFGVLSGLEGPGLAHLTRCMEYRDAYVSLLIARARDDQAVIRMLRWRDTKGLDILHNITESLTIKAPVRKAA